MDVPVIGWSFADLKDPKKEKKVMDPITVLVYAALFPCFEQGTKIGLYGRTVTMEEPSDYTWDIGFFKIPTRWAFRGWYKENNNNLEVFKLVAINATEYYDPVKNLQIKKLFEYARDGIVAAKQAYGNGQSSPCDAIDKYQEIITKAINGEFKFNSKLSDAEERVKNIWSEKEIIWLNQTISMILENKSNQKPVDTDLDSIQKKLKEKETLFRAICDEVKSGKLNTVKQQKPPAREEPQERASAPNSNIQKAPFQAQEEEGLVQGLNAEDSEFEVVVDKAPKPPAAAVAVALAKKKAPEAVKVIQEDEEVKVNFVEEVPQEPPKSQPAAVPTNSRKKKGT